ncbi:unnamed protein product [Symbiodinium natans]|uniref:Uncharacterized protein n=1 Tax=Symbiodinium natans TaxID=878477 RepID=A0A812SH29_9DINO|nr:unnamed protein product [Symbiodinium natans]
MASSEGAVKRRRVSVKTHGEQGQEDPEAEEAAGLADMVEPAVPAVPLFWSLPADENEPAESTLRHLIPYTRSEAWKWLLGHGKSLLGKSIPKSLEAVQPLKIQEGQGIKETWDLSNMKKALKGHGVYEAAATAWVLSIDAEGDVFVPGEKGHILCPFTMSGTVPKIPADTLPTKINVISGSRLLSSFYVQLAQAFKENNEDRVNLLMKASLSWTVTVYVNVSPQGRLLEENKLNTAMKAAGKHLGESWLSWSLRALQMASLEDVKLSGSDKSAADLNRTGLTLEGKPVNKNHTQCLMLQSQLLSGTSVQLLKDIERIYSPKALTQDYTKIMRVCKVCQGHMVVVKNILPGAEAVEIFLRSALVTLHRRVTDAAFFSITTIDPQNKVGYVSLVLTRYRIMHYLSNLVGFVEESASKKEMQDQVLHVFQDPLLFHATFPVSEEGVLDEEVANRVKAGLGHNCSRELLSLCQKITEGHFDEALLTLAADAELEKTLSSSHKEDDKVVGVLVAAIRQFGNLLESVRQGQSRAQSVS